ncbi:MAG: hypothetical protein P4L59_19010 [Desulfosporosinus sp.]|nr:hypothetical protein [Desulfosporosinus sp.]
MANCAHPAQMVKRAFFVFCSAKIGKLEFITEQTKVDIWSIGGALR